MRKISANYIFDGNGKFYKNGILQVDDDGRILSLIDTKENFTGDISEHEAGLLVAMMAKVAKADGNISELEAEVLSHTFTDISSYFKNFIIS